MSVDGSSGHPGIVAAQPRRPLETIDVMGPTRVAIAVRSLFLVGFNTHEMATLFNKREPEIVALLNAAPWPLKIEVRDA